MKKVVFKEFVDIKPYTTFKMGGLARFFGTVKSVGELEDALQFAEDKGLPVFILGSGSNILVNDSDMLEAVVIKIEIPGYDVMAEDSDSVTLKVGAGENWDSVVARAVESGWSGIEALSWIPGTAGATPIQNVGAYGAEISGVLVSLEAYDLSARTISNLFKEECNFSYRNSIFKHEAKGKFIITSVTLKLSKSPTSVPDYPGVKKYFAEKGIESPTLEQIRQAIINIRNIKLPDPRQIASVGSFFKNASVPIEVYEKLKQKYPDLVAFPMEAGNYKISTGWMLESLGLKGQEFGHLQFYPNNALVLINKGGATFDELTALVNKVRGMVEVEFGVSLEQEPIIIG